MKQRTRLLLNDISDKKGIEEEINRLQQLYDEFENKVRKRFTVLKAVWPTHITQERELREREELFRATFNQAGVGIAHIGLNGKWLRVNKKFCNITGWPSQELLNKLFLDITHPGDKELDFRNIKQLVDGKLNSITMEERFIRKDGSIRWVRATYSIVRTVLGKPKYCICIIVDIHEKKQIENTLRLLAEVGKKLIPSHDYRATLTNLAQSLVPYLADWCVVDVLKANKKVERIAVAHADSTKKELASEIWKYTPSLLDKSPIAEVLTTGKPIINFEISPILVKKPLRGSQTKQVITPASGMVIPLIARGNILGAITFIYKKRDSNYAPSDISLAKELAARAALAIDNAWLYNEAQKAIQIRDEFLSIASHELKTSLTTVKALAQILRKDYQKSNDTRSIGMLSKMDTQLNMTTKLVNDLLDVGRMQSGKFSLRKELFDVDRLMKNIIETAQRFTNTHKIILKGRVKKKIYADRDRIGQVVLNLITNAIKYSPDNTKIVVSVSRDEKNLIINVKDSGIGIPKDKYQKIFERFFRVLDKPKEKTSGLGLGLYISQILLTQHKGTIRVKSKEGKGSTFHITLPLRRKRNNQNHT